MVNTSDVPPQFHYSKNVEPILGCRCKFTIQTFLNPFWDVDVDAGCQPPTLQVTLITSTSACLYHTIRAIHHVLFALPMSLICPGLTSILLLDGRIIFIHLIIGHMDMEDPLNCQEYLFIMCMLTTYIASFLEQINTYLAL